MPKLIPVAMTDFRKIIENNCAFVDKTRFLEVYENSKTKVSMLLRPRRFGKTMFTELLMKSSYYVLKFDFSGISSDDSTSDIMADFRKKVINGIADFLLRYPVFILSEIRQKVPDGSNLNDLYNAIIGYYSDKNAFLSVSLLTDYFIYSLKPLSSGQKRKICLGFLSGSEILQSGPDH